MIMSANVFLPREKNPKQEVRMMEFKQVHSQITTKPVETSLPDNKWDDNKHKYQGKTVEHPK